MNLKLTKIALEHRANELVRQSNILYERNQQIIAERDTLKAQRDALAKLLKDGIDCFPCTQWAQSAKDALKDLR